jgi:hypothetical protein
MERSCGSIGRHRAGASPRLVLKWSRSLCSRKTQTARRRPSARAGLLRKRRAASTAVFAGHEVESSRSPARKWLGARSFLRAGIGAPEICGHTALAFARDGSNPFALAEPETAATTKSAAARRIDVELRVHPIERCTVRHCFDRRREHRMRGELQRSKRSNHGRSGGCT